MFPARIKIDFNSCGILDKAKGNGPEFVTIYETPGIGVFIWQALSGIASRPNPERRSLS
jgi:hypothetical protein